MSQFQVTTRMQRHDVHKLHGLGNDFLVWFQPAVPAEAADLARQWCDRHTGVGADGLIVAIDHKTSPSFHLFNADGSVAEVSGNGLRCMAHAIAARRGLDEVELEIATLAGTRWATVTQGLAREAQVAVGMGVPAPGAALAGLDLEAIVSHNKAQSVDMGNPHVVIEVDSIDSYDITTVGPAVEALFPETGMNVHLSMKTDHGVKIAIWERGVGVTDACGSGACAAAAVAAAAEPDATSFVVEMPGGSATVAVHDELTLQGPSVYVAAIAGLDDFEAADETPANG